MSIPLSSFYQTSRTALSFEFFPPKTERGESSLYCHVQKLIEFKPDFVTCTYGAGGSTRHKTMDVVCHMKQTFQIPVASHLTLVESTQQQLREYLQRAADNQIDYIVALRGDPPAGRSEFQAAAGGLQYANQLVDLICAEFSFSGIAVAGYPEKHLEAPNWQVDLENLKRKVDAGADVVITQLFYNNADFFRFRERCERIGIGVPIVPGILPVTNLHQVERITSMCGSKLPSHFLERLRQRPDDAEWHFEVGTDHAIGQVQELIENGSSGLHFYVLNKSKATIRILTEISSVRKGFE